MKCLECGSTMTVGRGNYKYLALPGVTLVNVAISRCSHCGEEEVAIPRIAQLHRLIANALIRKKARLNGPEVRFLRKFLDWTSAQLAERFGVAAETVSRWEHGKEPIGPTADRLLRLCVARHTNAVDYPLELMSAVSRRSEKPPHIRIRLDKNSWQLPAAV